MSTLYVEEILEFQRLFCKLTLLTAEDTNAHKMDGLFVNLSSEPYTYLAVEAKTSILPTSKSTFKGHRYGILKQMIQSLDKYGDSDLRFDFVAIRDSLEESFKEEVAKKIRKDLIPPGPALNYLGMAAINEVTISSEDDDYILATKCSRDFAFRGLTVTNLATLATSAYSKVLKLREAAQ